MIDHFSLGVSSLPKARAFYDRLLAPLGYEALYEIKGAVAYGPEAPHYIFWIGETHGETVVPPAGFHVALIAPDRAAVDRFHAEGLAAGGREAGHPGLRPDYGETYYAAFVLDPDGHKIEAVCYRPD